MTEQEKKWKDGIINNGKTEYPYLCNITLKHQIFKGTEYNDHVHCDLCWEKISIYSDDAHDGYRSDKQNIWICNQCFCDFQNFFSWKTE